MDEATDALRHFLDLIGQAQFLEYEFVFLYPQVAERLSQAGPESAAATSRDQGGHGHAETLAILGRLTDDSLLHLAKTRAIMEELKGPLPPLFTPEPLPGDLELRPFFERQLEREKLAAWVYDQATPLAPDKALQKDLAQFAQDERRHAEGVERILRLLP